MKNIGFQISNLSLIAVNLVPLAGVLFYGWDLFTVTLIYGIESLVMGVSLYFKAIFIIRDDPSAADKVVTDLVFAGVAYVVFLPLFFIMTFAVLGPYSVYNSTFASAWDVTRVFFDPKIFVTVLLLVVSHGVSFLYNYVAQKEYEAVNFGRLCGNLAGRVFVVMTVVSFGGWAVVISQSNVGGAVVLVLVKIFVDILGHLHEHGYLNLGKPVSPAKVANKDQRFIPTRRRRR